MHTIDTSQLNTTAQAYDAIAPQYVALVRDGLARLPLDRSIIEAFAGLVRQTGAGPVGDLGCGPGYVAAHLRDLGLDVFGVDLSEALIEHARALYPDLRFSVGSMAALDVADGTLGGIVAWYSIIHAAPADVPVYLAEFHRALAPGGHLLLGFFESGGEPLTPFDHAVTTAHRWPVDQLAGLAKDAGFQELGRMLRQPLENERFQHGRLILRRE
ncbi:class I SAM-dependent methyltransferase [Streptomyces sp.]|uniref:class I SAM-dependent DNA methyltransferase n=1 Tax=Streptomyces sp. TaxID=1931 RepID=UPI002D2B668D|nr:class I SAM-dependent methyltransferase [Streptomyces sp.]HZF88395.1 class I SAM-dependent methyltransferase [Streptomyces sp.]